MATKLDHIYGVGGQVGNLSNRVATLETNAAKKNEANTFTQSQTVKDLTLKTNGNEAKFISFNNGNTRIGYVGKASSGDNNDMTIQSNGKIVLAASGNISANNKIIEGVATPTANNHAASKYYVDTRVSALTTLPDKTNINFKTTDINWASDGITNPGKYQFSLWIKDRASNIQMNTMLYINMETGDWACSEIVGMEKTNINSNAIQTAPTWFIQLAYKKTAGNKLELIKRGVEANMPTNVDIKLAYRKIT